MQDSSHVHSHISDPRRKSSISSSTQAQLKLNFKLKLKLKLPHQTPSLHPLSRILLTGIRALEIQQRDPALHLIDLARQIAQVLRQTGGLVELASTVGVGDHLADEELCSSSTISCWRSAFSSSSSVEMALLLLLT